jgi:hypothetical protein
LAIAVPAAEAAPNLPVGEADGVRVRSDNGAIAVVFTPRAARLYRRIAGRVITIGCTDLPSRRNLGITGIPSKLETFRAPKRRSTLRTISVPAEDQDYCRVWRGRSAETGDRVVSVPLTQTGAVYLDEEARVREMGQLITFAGILADRRRSLSWPTAADLFDAEFGGRRVRDFWPRPLAALDSPSATPPAGALGYYSDGAEHIAVVIVSASGRRLFYELDADDVLRTNVAGYFYDDVGI